MQRIIDCNNVFWTWQYLSTHVVPAQDQASHLSTRRKRGLVIPHPKTLLTTGSCSKNIFKRFWCGVSSHLLTIYVPRRKTHTQPYIFKYATGSTIAGQLPTLHAVRIHFPMDNSKKLLLTTYSVSSGLLLTPAGQPTWPRSLYSYPMVARSLPPEHPSSMVALDLGGQHLALQ